MSTISDWQINCSRLVSEGGKTVFSFLALLCLVAILQPSHLRAQDANLMEVFWQFKYDGGVNTVVGSRYDGERFYVSVGDLFGALQVNIVQEPSQNMAHGFYLRTSQPFEIDFNAGRATVGTSELLFEATEFVREDLGYFLSPALLDRLFNLTIQLDERNLALTLSTPDDMPVVAEQRRQASRVVRRDQTFLERNAPLLFDRNRSFVSGGVVGYRIATELQGAAPRAAVNVRGGGELLGGDLELGMNANYAPGVIGEQNFAFDVDSWQWRYVVRNMPAMRQAQVGQLSSDGLRSFQYLGARLSNDPVDVQRFFGSYPMRVESLPGWEIELYLNSQLVDVRQADATGIVNFSIPITYGSTAVTIREYGPSGEFRETERRIQVPFTFVPPGEIRYNLYAGQSTTGNRNLIQATTSIGLTSWLTAKWGFDYVTPDTTRAGEELANLSWGSISARLGPSYVLSARAAPGGLYRASLNAFFPSLASFSLDFTKFDGNGIYNQSARRHESRAMVSLPFQFFRVPMNWRTTLSERLDNGDIYAFSAQQDLSFNPGVFRLSLGMRGDARYIDSVFVPTLIRFEPRVGYSFGRTNAVPRPLRGLLISLRSSYDVENNKLLSLSANVSRRIARVVRFQTDVSHQFDTQDTALSLRLSMDLNSIRTTTGAAIRSASGTSFTQDVSGAVSYDIGSRKLDMADRDWVGRSAATIRMFVDYNGNDEQDEGEPTIENGGVSFRRAVTTQQGSNGYIIVYNLQAYEQYNLTVDQTRIRNPFWVPKTEEFSFITDPNVHKVIDIPFLVTGEVTGSVLRQSAGGLTSVPGLKLRIEQLDGDRIYEEPVFSDGTFYKLGMLPGRYRARVDSSQLRILGVVSDPPVREFEVEPTELGDSVDGVDFVLRPRSAVVSDAQPPSQQSDQQANQQAAQPTDEPVAEDEQVDVDPADTPVETVQPEDARPETDDATPPQPPSVQPETADTQPEDDAVRDDVPADAAPDEDTTPGVDALATPAQATVYIIQNGLAGLKELARMVYQDETLWPKIWLANTDRINTPADVRSGMQLVIPPRAPLTPVERAAGAGYEAEQGQGQGQNPTGQNGQQTHTVLPSDASLSSIARRYYGNTFLWVRIWLANLDVLPNPDAIEPRMQLVIPPAGAVTQMEVRATELYQEGDLDGARALVNGSAGGALPGQQPQQDPQPQEQQAPRQDQQQQDPQTQDQQPQDPQQPPAHQPETQPQQSGSTSQNAQPPAVNQEESAGANSATVHSVASGDLSLMNLARRYYDDAFLWPKIWVANRSQLPRPEDLELGMELQIPAKAPLTQEERAALEEYQNR